MPEWGIDGHQRKEDDGDERMVKATNERERESMTIWGIFFYGWF